MALNAIRSTIITTEAKTMMAEIDDRVSVSTHVNTRTSEFSLLLDTILDQLRPSAYRLACCLIQSKRGCQSVLAICW